VLKFVDNLETIIRSDLKDEQGRSDNLLRALSRLDSVSSNNIEVDV
jgi:hypothetical protein